MLNFRKKKAPPQKKKKKKKKTEYSTTSKPFTSNVYIPQGDSLGPVLFTVYLEQYAFKEVRHTLPRPTTSFEAEIPNEVAYADDVDLFSQNYADIKKIQEYL